MKAIEVYRMFCRVLASAALISLGLYYSLTQPGPMDVISGAVIGLTLFCLWFCRDRIQ